MSHSNTTSVVINVQHNGTGAEQSLISVVTGTIQPGTDGMDLRMSFYPDYSGTGNNPWMMYRIYMSGSTSIWGSGNTWSSGASWIPLNHGTYPVGNGNLEMFGFTLYIQNSMNTTSPVTYPAFYLVSNYGQTSGLRRTGGVYGHVVSNWSGTPGIQSVKFWAEAGSINYALTSYTIGGMLDA